MKSSLLCLAALITLDLNAGAAEPPQPDPLKLQRDIQSFESRLRAAKTPSGKQLAAMEATARDLLNQKRRLWEAQEAGRSAPTSHYLAPEKEARIRVVLQKVKAEENQRALVKGTPAAPARSVSSKPAPAAKPSPPAPKPDTKAPAPGAQTAPPDNGASQLK
ncbi:MAG: hypothetical protein AB1705_02695 [Verrucomicrobiota bacterium]